MRIHTLIRVQLIRAYTRTRLFPLAPSGLFWVLWPHVGPYGALDPICPFWAFFGAFFRALGPIGLTGPEALLAWGRLRKIGTASLGIYFTAP